MKTKLLYLLAVLGLVAVASGESDNADPLVIGRLYVLIFLFVLFMATVFLISKTQGLRAPLEIGGVYYDRETGRIELKVKNSDENSYRVVSTLRRVCHAAEIVPEGGELPMLSGSASSGGIYELLCENFDSVLIKPNSVETLVYDSVLANCLDEIKELDEINVRILYGNNNAFESIIDETVPLAFKGDHKYLRTVDDDKKLHLRMGNTTLAEIASLEQLSKELKMAPNRVVDFHLGRINDFSEWVRTVVGDEVLAERLLQISFYNPRMTKKEIVELIDARMDELRNDSVYPSN